MKDKTTMDDIALQLNLSKSLISRALSDKYGVCDETRNKIKLAAIQMGYRFHGKKKDIPIKTESITIIVERHDLLDSGFWVKIINGIEKELNKKNISVFLSVIENDKENTMPLSIRQMKTNGVIILGQIPMKHVVSVNTSGLPIVLVDSPFPNLKFDHVIANNYFGAYEATEYLVNHGHCRVGFVGATSYSFSFKERFRGFFDCMNENKSEMIKMYPMTDQYDDFDIPFSRKQFQDVMLSNDHPTAVLCANDITAFIVYEMLAVMEFKVPEDVSVVGFDNVPKSEWVSPMLTTVNIPKTLMGERAVELLLKRIENPESNVELLSIGTKIIRRNSVYNLKGEMNTKSCKIT